MELGVYSLSDIQGPPGGGPPPSFAERLDDIVAYGILADRLGLDVYGVGEHHALAFAVSSPAVALAAIAQATQRIRLASAVTVLGTLDPVRVYQDYATLDLISHGRAEVGVGRSAFIEPFTLFGEDPADYDALFAEKLSLLLKIRDEPRVTWSGRFRARLEGAEVAPRAFVPSLPIWVGIGGTPASAERAGRLGLPMALAFIGGTLAHARGLIDTYRQAGARAGHAPERLHVALFSHLHVGRDDREAMERVYPYYRQYLSPKTPGGRGWLVERPAAEAMAGRGGALMVGGVERVVQKIIDMREQLGVDRFFGQIDFGGLPRPWVEESVSLLAEEVAPRVRAATGGRSS